MLPSLSEKHKICSNCTKLLIVTNSLLIQYYQQKMKIFQWNGLLLFDFILFTAML